MKKYKRFSRRAFSTMLSNEEAADIFPLIEKEAYRLKQKLDEEFLDDQVGEEIARRLFRLERVCRRISKALEEKQEAEIGHEPEFMHALRDAIESGTL